MGCVGVISVYVSVSRGQCAFTLHAGSCTCIKPIQSSTALFRYSMEIFTSVLSIVFVILNLFETSRRRNNCNIYSHNTVTSSRALGEAGGGSVLKNSWNVCLLCTCRIVYTNKCHKDAPNQPVVIKLLLFFQFKASRNIIVLGICDHRLAYGERPTHKTHRQTEMHYSWQTSCNSAVDC